jgi:hypothetical protein
MRRQTFLLLLVLVGVSSANQLQPNDQQQIDNLVRSFASAMAHGRDPSPFLAPNASGGTRDKEIEIARKPYTEFIVSGFSVDRNLTFTDADHAALKAWVSYQTPHLSQQTETTIHFEKVAGAWYITDFEFLKFNWAPTILMSALGILYAGVVLSFFNHWRKHRFARRTFRSAWLVLIFTPIGWILYPVLKPWQGSPPRPVGSPG